jgi:hypothetical protein
MQPEKGVDPVPLLTPSSTGPAELARRRSLRGAWRVAGSPCAARVIAATAVNHGRRSGDNNRIG